MNFIRHILVSQDQLILEVLHEWGQLRYSPSTSDAIDVFIRRGCGKPLRACFYCWCFLALFSLRAASTQFLIKSRRKRTAFLSDSIFTDEIGNKRKARYRERDQRVCFEIISNYGTFIVTGAIQLGEKLQRKISSREDEAKRESEYHDRVSTQMIHCTSLFL